MMYATCNLCDCTLPLSYDAQKTKFNLLVHFKGNRHFINQKEMFSPYFHVDCNLCNVSNRIFNGEPYFTELLNHISSPTHSKNIDAYIECLQEPDTSESECYTNNSYYSEEEYSDEYEYEESNEYTSNEDIDDSGGDNSYSDDDNSSYEYRSPFFYCRLCQCKVHMTVKSNDATLHQIWTHINGYQHQENLKDENNNNPNGLDCNLCQCYLQLSYDDEASVHNIKTHIGGYRHCQNLPPPDEEDDGTYSSLIYQPD